MQSHRQARMVWQNRANSKTKGTNRFEHIAVSPVDTRHMRKMFWWLETTQHNVVWLMKTSPMPQPRAMMLLWWMVDVAGDSPPMEAKNKGKSDQGEPPNLEDQGLENQHWQQLQEPLCMLDIMPRNFVPPKVPPPIWTRCKGMSPSKSLRDWSVSAFSKVSA